MTTTTETAADPLDRLIQDLNGADVVAARAALERYEPFLRMAVRRHLRGPLRAKLDSMDVVQSIWADLLIDLGSAHWRFQSPAHLRAFLVRVARNRLIDHHRRHRRALENERTLDRTPPRDLPGADVPRPSEVAQGRELWERILEVCPPAHREILIMKREGRSLAEIALHCRLHESSVRRILYDLARRLRPDPERSSR